MSDLRAVTWGHITASPKFAEHVTLEFAMLLGVVIQVTVFVPDCTLLSSLAMFSGTLAFPHTVAAQVNVTSSLRDAERRLTSHVGIVTAEHNIVVVVVVVVVIHK